MLAGLAAAGVDLTTADVIVGTSAGSVVGAQIASGRSLEELYAIQHADATGEVRGSMSFVDTLRYVLASAWPGDDQRARARVGRLALAAHTVSAAERRAVIESRLGDRAWPERRLLITAVDAETGDLLVLDREAGVPLIDAVGASCAVPLVWPPVTINRRRYVDGGVRSVANADLAAGCQRVVVLAPIILALRRSARLSVQIRALGPGVRSVVIAPDREARKAMGGNLLDPSHRAASALAGRAQAAAVATQVAEVWTIA